MENCIVAAVRTIRVALLHLLGQCVFFCRWEKCMAAGVKVHCAVCKQGFCSSFRYGVVMCDRCCSSIEVHAKEETDIHDKIQCDSSCALADTCRYCWRKKFLALGLLHDSFKKKIRRRSDDFGSSYLIKVYVAWGGCGCCRLVCTVKI